MPEYRANRNDRVNIAQRRGIWNNAGTRFDYDSSSSSFIPAYGKRVRRRRRPEIASCGQLRIYKGPADQPGSDRRGDPSILSILQPGLCECVSIASLRFQHTVPRSSRGARCCCCCCSVPMKPLTASGSQSPTSHWYSGQLPVECSILQAVVYDPDKLAFAGFRREKSRVVGRNSRCELSQPRLELAYLQVHNFCLDGKLPPHIRQRIRASSNALISESKSLAESIKFRESIKPGSAR